MTTTETRTYSIISQNEVAGQAPGTSRYAALETFNRDALGGDGEMRMTANGARLVLAGEVGKPDTDAWFRAEELNGNDDEVVDATDGDPRYTSERLATMTAREIDQHLNERVAQRDRAKRDITRCHNTLARLEDPDSATYTTTIANLGSYTREHATLNRIIRQLETAQEKRRLAEIGSEAADARALNVDLVDAEITKRGMPCGIEEVDDTDMAARMWAGAAVALENETDADRVTQAAVASRVADAYAIIYGYDEVAPTLDRATRDAAQADADQIERMCGIPVGRDVTLALAVCLTDPKIRMHLDPKALEQARGVLGLAD